MRGSTLSHNLKRFKVSAVKLKAPKPMGSGHQLTYLARGGGGINQEFSSSPVKRMVSFDKTLRNLEHPINPRRQHVHAICQSPATMSRPRPVAVVKVPTARRQCPLLNYHTAGSFGV